jgi:hypothetical protein
MDDALGQLNTPESCEQYARNVERRHPEQAQKARRKAVELKAHQEGAESPVDLPVGVPFMRMSERRRRLGEAVRQVGGCLHSSPSLGRGRITPLQGRRDSAAGVSHPGVGVRRAF